MDWENKQLAGALFHTLRAIQNPKIDHDLIDAARKIIALQNAEWAERDAAYARGDLVLTSAGYLPLVRSIPRP